MMLKEMVSILLLVFTFSFGQTQSIFDVSRNAQDSIETSSSTNKEDQKNTGLNENFSNPFEVSHIPIRKNQNISSKPKSNQNQAVTISPLFIILLSALILGILLMYYRGLIADLIQAITNMNYMQSFKAKMIGINLPFLFGLYIIFFLNLSLFLILAANLLGFPGKIQPIWLVFFIIALIYLLRHGFLSLFGWIFELEGEAGTFSFIIALLNICLGIILIPSNLIIAFAPQEIAKILVFIVILLIIGILLIRYFRGIMIGANHIRNHSFQFFLYFCTFEIAPVLIILYWMGI